jgi:hypothetical protein
MQSLRQDLPLPSAADPSVSFVLSQGPYEHAHIHCEKDAHGYKYIK